VRGAGRTATGPCLDANAMAWRRDGDDASTARRPDGADAHADNRVRGAFYFGATVFGGVDLLVRIGGWMGSPNTRRLVGCGAKELALWGVPTG
jgi:hypothetical protein